MQATISIPRGWQYPRFSFGQRTENGLIIGMKYYSCDTFLANEYGEGWRYFVLPDKHGEDEQHLLEEDLKLLTPHELKTQIEAQIKNHLCQLELLKQELRAIPINAVAIQPTAERECPSQEQEQFSVPHPHLYALIDAAQLILKEIAEHPDFLALDYQPDLTVGDAQTALSYLQSELESSQQLNTASDISNQK
ncbi:hypothetical protein [Nostoc parmelioides]|uniref:Uncharacterized protein n=1 Tax=Nostoc parmelioides FACHB-3921 TaxID=2692909 RepID=A0ABR8BL66_9NOSO|nr:hypothetical protein [Nostoc parmelioides]MBD2254630.1 hypothetical protein [Nostoc parmelioides FACHB-3921]